uniref:Plexin-B1 n=1 Tax=Sinocyclocheilus rhinocerous TaxID=307959 RepID=A0A673LCE5_9TELE
MALVVTLLQSLILGVLGVHSSYPRFSSNDSVFQHLALHPDPSIGTVYVGARDHLFQLAGLDGLRLEVDERTGPVRDSKDCLPPVTLENCPQAGLVNNHNKLLLVDPYSLLLITCGSVHQGTCQKRSLANVNEVLFSAERPVDTQYVAANDPTASTVGLVVRPQDKDPVLYVGRGYTSSHPPVSTRQLSTEPVFSYEETAKLAVAGRLSEYDHNFVATFARHNHVYFLFYRRDLKATSREYRTYVARVCLDDQAYYSYVEVPLMCHSGSTGRNYNFLQGAQVGGEESGGSQVLMGVFSTAVSAANGPGEESALCVYSLDEVDRGIDATRDLCYTQYGVKDGYKVAYIEYDVKSNCANLPTNTLNAYPCGSDHTPSPMASREPVEAKAVLDSPAARLTAVAVSVKEGHTIVFLGDSKGNLHKVSTFSTFPAHFNDTVIILITVEKRPVAECDKHTDCTSCLAVKDPYCGWCVLDVLLLGCRGGIQEHDLSQEEGLFPDGLPRRPAWYVTRCLPRLCTCCTLFVSRVFCLAVRLYNCSVGRADCSRCHTADQQYGCVWCEGSRSSCVYRSSCTEHVQQTCPAPHIHTIEPLSGPVEGGTVLTVSGSNLGQRAEDIQHSVTVAGVPCTVIPDRYEVSSSIVCETTASAGEQSGHISVQVKGGGIGQSAQRFRYQDPVLLGVSPLKGPMSGGTSLTITGQNLLTGRSNEISILIGGVPCYISPEQYNNEGVECVTGGSNRTGESGVTVRFGRAERHLQEVVYQYTPDPNVTHAAPSKSFISGGRIIRVSGLHLDVVQEPRIHVTLTPLEPMHMSVIVTQLRCTVNSSTLILCPTPEVGPEALRAAVSVHFLLDNLHFEFEAVSGSPFSYEPNPVLHSLNQHDPSKPFRHKPGSIISVEGENLDLAMSKDEVVALIGDGECAVKTLTRNHLYCEPPTQQPSVVRMGNLNFSLGRVQYDSQGPAAFPLEAQVGVGLGASIVALIVLVIVLIYRRKSKQALRDYKKVQIQLENLETSVRDRCKKEFTDLMTEMMDVSSDLMGSGIPVLDYRKYSERIFFPGHRDSPLRRDLDVPACRRATVEQGLVQLSNLLNSKLFLTKFIHTLEAQRTFSPRDRAYVASLLTVALHGKLEYFTDILKTLLSHLVEQYTTKNPKLMLRRTESVVEKLLTNWMSICLYTFLRDTAGEAFYMLFRAIKHQVDKGPVDAVSGKAKYTLNDNRLLREDVEYRTLTLNVLVSSGGAGESQTVPTKVLDCDTITQVKEKIVEQTLKGTSYSQRPSADSVHLEWRAGMAGHLILSDQDLTSVVQGSWKRLNTLQHYKVPDGATVTLVSRQSKQIHHDSHDYIPGEKTPMLEDGDEGGVKQWHLVKAGEEAELPKHRRGSLRDKERERAKAIPEIYLTRLLSVKGTLQKFVDDLFTVILSTSQPVPLAVKYFFDLLDDQAAQHNITDPETIHIWKTNSLPLRFWINILKNPQFIFDVQASDNVDAVLSVIAQTFMDSCTIADHKLGRDSPINKLLYARDIPRYKQMVERYYSDIRQTIPVSDQEMNSSLAELSRNYSNEVNHLVALHELYKYINKYYDQIITALEEDSTAQKMQLGYRLQQIAAAVENKVTDL